jgi:hypothetical protein
MQTTEGMAGGAKIAVFLMHGCGARRMLGRVGSATFERGFAEDLLQVQRGEISDSSFGCASFDCGGPARRSNGG